VIDKQSFRLTLPNHTTVRPISGSLTLDESWEPYAQGTLTIEAPESLAPFDPRNSPPPRVGIEMMQEFYETQPVLKITDAYGAGTVAGLTAAWGSGTLAQVTAVYTVLYVDPIKEPVIRTANLSILGYSTGPDGLLELELASDDAYLEGHTHRGSANNLLPLTLTDYVRTIVQEVLPNANFVEMGPQMDLSPYKDPESGSGYISWSIGEGAREKFQTFIEKAAARVWADETGNSWHMASSPRNTSASLSVTALTDWSDELSRYDADFANAVGISDIYTLNYGDNDDSAFQLKSWDFATSGPGPYRWLIINRDTGLRNAPGTGQAGYVLGRTLSLGRAVSITAVNNFQTNPGDAISVTFPNESTISGRVSSVSWDFESGEMSVRVRDPQ
jgi:hypothetical protein